MKIMLGNLSVEDIEDKLGINLPADLKTFLKGSRQHEVNKIKEGKWHCYDMPFHMVCGDMAVAEKVYGSLKDQAQKCKRSLPISIQT